MLTDNDSKFASKKISKKGSDARCIYKDRWTGFYYVKMNKKVTDKVLYLLQKKFNREEFKKNVANGCFSLISNKFPNEN